MTKIRENLLCFFKIKKNKKTDHSQKYDDFDKINLFQRTKQASRKITVIL